MASQIDPRGIEPQEVVAAANFSGTRVLEIGSGNGRLTFALAALARSVIGIDLKHGELVHPCSSTRLGQVVRFVCASAISLPFRGAGFDIAVLASSL